MPVTPALRNGDSRIPGASWPVAERKCQWKALSQVTKVGNGGDDSWCPALASTVCALTCAHVTHKHRKGKEKIKRGDDKVEEGGEGTERPVPLHSQLLTTLLAVSRG